MTERRDGAAPTEMLAALDSEVHHLQRDVVGLQGDARQLDVRLRGIETDVAHLVRLAKWGGTVVSAVLVSGIGAVVALLLRR